MSIQCIASIVFLTWHPVYVHNMNRTWLHHLMLVLAALVVAVASVEGAARMAPTALDDAGVAVWLANGASLDDFCGEHAPEGGHHPCPFCHKLGETPEADVAPRELRVVFSLASGHDAADQLSTPQRCNSQVSARAPPEMG